MTEINELKLLSPSGADPVLYYWPLCKTKQYNGAAEIVETIRWVGEDYPELKVVLEKCVLSKVDLNSYESMKTLCDKYNKAVSTIRQLWKGATKPNSKCSQWASTALLRHIIQQCYNRSVIDPDKLNQYEPFSPEVYGETSYDLIHRMIEEVKLTEEDMFIDLGSGVGQVVCQVAAASRCAKCIGIEKSDVPSEFAITLEKEFRKWMKWYGKRYQEFELIKGDFFDTKYRDLIMSSNLVFVNNFAFGPEVDHKLKLIFADMKDGTKIVSSKAFCPINFRITDRHMSEIGSIMNVKELSSLPGAVSWTGKPVTYFLHTVDRRKLESYFTAVKNNGNGNGGNGSSSSAISPNSGGCRDESRRRISSNKKCLKRNFALASSSKVAAGFAASDLANMDSCEVRLGDDFPPATYSKRSMSNDDDENVVYGPTTRRQWSSWVAQQEKMKRKSQDKDVTTKQRTSIGTSKGRKSALSARSSPDLDNLSSSNSDTSYVANVENVRPQRATGHRGPGRPRKSTTAIKAQEAKRKYQIHQRKIASSRETGGTSNLGRPLKHVKKKSAEWIETLDFFHKQIVDGANSAVDSSHSSPVKIEQTPSIAALLPSMPVTVSSTARNSDSAMNTFIDNIRRDYESILQRMQTPEFRNELIRAIESEKVRQKQLKLRKDQLEKQVQILQDEGSHHLNSRLQELDVKAVTPAELLTKAKEIVMQHQDLQARAAVLEAEVKNLELQNQQLMILAKGKEELLLKSGILQSLGYDSSASSEETKKAILMEIGSMFTHRRAYLNEISRMESEIHLLESLVQLNSTNATLPDGTIKSPFASPISVVPQLSAAQIIATTIATSSSASVTQSQVLSTSSTVPTTVAMATGSGGGGLPAPSGVISGCPAPMAPPTRSSFTAGKRPRGGGKSSRVAASAVVGQRKKQQNSAKSTILDAQRRDDIDEQVEEMVRKIKNMNSAASQQTDKDKKGRLSEKKSRGSCGPSSLSSRGFERRRDKKREFQSAPYPSSRPEPSVPGQSLSLTSIGSSQTSNAPSLTPSMTSSAVQSHQSVTLVVQQMGTPNTIDQTVDAVSHGLTSNSVITFSSPGLVPVLPMVLPPPPPPQSSFLPVEPMVMLHRLRRESASTESLPSDHEEFIGQKSARGILHKAGSAPIVAAVASSETTGGHLFDDTKFTLPANVSLPGGPGSFGPRSGAVSKVAENQQLQRPSSVPAHHHRSAIISSFSIGSLISEQKKSSSSIDDIDETETSSFSRYPRVHSAYARMEQASIAGDSGYAESIHSSSETGGTSSSIKERVFEPPKEPIIRQNLFKNTSNTGQPGNPHDYSNPGNPETSKEMLKTESLKQGISSPSRPRALPVATATALIIDESPTDLIEPKTLLNPFRIPRLERKDALNSTKMQCSPDTRSPLAAHVTSVKKDEPRWSSGGGADDARIRRKRKNVLEERGFKRRLYSGANDLGNPIDEIMNSMVLPTTTTNPTLRKRNNDSISESSSTTNSRQKPNFPRTAGESKFTLTRESLERHTASADGHHFAQKGLMEALLEHKMNTGRIEPHSILAPKLHLTIFGSGAKGPSPSAASASAGAAAARGPQTPPGTPPSFGAVDQSEADKRGPKTPQDTPPSSASGRSISVSSHSRCSDNAGQSASAEYLARDRPADSFARLVSVDSEYRRTIEQESGGKSSHLLDTIAKMANIEPAQVTQLLSSDALRTLQDLDPAVLVATLSTLLGTLMQTVAATKLPKKLKRRTTSGGVGNVAVAAASSTSALPRNSNNDDSSSVHYQEPHVTSTCDPDNLKPTGSNRVASTTKSEERRQDEMDLASSASGDTPLPKKQKYEPVQRSQEAEIEPLLASRSEAMTPPSPMRPTVTPIQAVDLSRPPPAMPPPNPPQNLPPNFPPPPVMPRPPPFLLSNSSSSSLAVTPGQPPYPMAQPRRPDFNIPPPNFAVPNSGNGPPVPPAPSSGVDYSFPPLNQPMARPPLIFPPPMAVDLSQPPPIPASAGRPPFGGDPSLSLDMTFVNKIDALTLNVISKLSPNTFSQIASDVDECSAMARGLRSSRYFKDYSHVTMAPNDINLGQLRPFLPELMDSAANITFKYNSFNNSNNNRREQPFGDGGRDYVSRDMISQQGYPCFNGPSGPLGPSVALGPPLSAPGPLLLAPGPGPPPRPPVPSMFLPPPPRPPPPPQPFFPMPPRPRPLFGPSDLFLDHP